MPERATVNQVVQIGVETTEGTAVAANKRLTALSVLPHPTVEFSDPFIPAGYKYATVVAENREWSEAALDGRLTYTEIVYPLSGILGTAVITTPGGGTTSRLWTWSPSSTVADAAKSFTVETGDATLAEKVAGLRINELTIDITRDGDITLGGSAFGRLYQTGQTLTASPTEIALVPVMPGHFSLYIDPTSGALGTTKLTRAFEASISIANRFGMIWPVDAALTSYGATVELVPDAAVELTLEADATGMGYLATARLGSTMFIRLQAVGAILEAALPYTFTFDFAGKITAIGEKADRNGVMVIPYTFTIVHDSGWGKALTVAVQNLLTAL